ncbi:hypothetical protein [Rhizosphaericola mali]|uniref:Uncharacterized protein n=1 Tax=Rhizosphaericola mali TaxID=2545455 RepID=A0A5P2G1C9_9BACT|nr:hypothetical protein [Rhizosphaericola mali]QES87640.1 hypothetical protein E0W69_002800 [Rhizosphaericola mali]
MRALKKEEQKEKDLGLEFNKANYQICANNFPVIENIANPSINNTISKITPRNLSMLYHQYYFHLLKPPILQYT